MKTHELKTWPASFQPIWDGIKLLEIRKNDRGFRAGDVLELHEWDEKALYSGRKLLAKVIHVVQGEYGLPPEICAMSIAVYSRREK